MSNPLENHEKSTSPEIADGLRYLAPHYDAYMLDVYGVIYDGIELYPEAIDCLERLKQAGKKTCLLTNAPECCDEMVQKLKDKGLDRSLYTDIVTAGDSAHDALQAHKGKNCWYSSQKQFGNLIEGLDLNLVTDTKDADIILNAISSACKFPLDEIKKQWAIGVERGLEMICANPDLVVNIGDTQHICAGTYAVMYEEAGGKVSWHGKPHTPVYDLAWRKLGMPEKSRILAIGDSLHTDIQGANNFGIASVFNLVGIHWEEVQLDHRAGEADVEKIRAMIASQPHKPTAILCGLAW